MKERIRVVRRNRHGVALSCVTVLLPVDEVAAVHEAAALARVSLTAFVREALRGAMEAGDGEH